MKRRIESTTSRTAEMTCVSRACSVLETNPYYMSDDNIAPLLLPSGLRPFLHISLVRRLFTKVAAPKGIYEYVIVRTKYIDAVFKQALVEQFDQILIFGAGFDTRALRFQDAMGNTNVFELDVPLTQQAKIGQYEKRHLAIPENLTFIAIDFNKESLSTKLNEAGFSKNQRSLFILEGLVMYLQPSQLMKHFESFGIIPGMEVGLCLTTSTHLFCGRKAFTMVKQKLSKPYPVLMSNGSLGLRRDRSSNFLPNMKCN